MYQYTACDLTARSLRLPGHNKGRLGTYQHFESRSRVSRARLTARVILTQNQGTQAQGTQAQQLGPARALLSLALATVVGFGGITGPLPAQADSGLEARQTAMQKRKELLAKTRERALQLGGTEGAPEVGGATAEEEEKVNRDTAEAERSNLEREREADSMRSRLKSSLQTYEESAKKGESMKPKTDAPTSPSWFKALTDEFTELKSKSKEVPAESAAPSAPAQPSKPAFTFGDPAPEAAPPNSEYSQPEPKSPLPEPLPQTPKEPELPKPSFRFETPAQPSKPSIPETVPLPAPTPDTKSTPSLASSSGQKPWWEKAFQAEPAPQPAASPVLESKPAVIQSATKEREAAKKAAPPKQQEVKPEPVVEKNKKRKGPLPMFLSQLLVLASFGGLGYVSIKKEEETRKVLAFAAKATSTAYGKVEGLLPKKK